MKAIKYVLLMIAIYHAPSLAVQYEVIPGTSLRVNSAIPLAYDYATNETIPWPTGGSGAAGVREGYNLTTPKGTKIPVTVTHTLPKGAVSKAGAGLLKFAGPVGQITTAISLGMLIWDAGLGKWVMQEDGYQSDDGYRQNVEWAKTSDIATGPYYKSANSACQAHGYIKAILDSPTDNFGDCTFTNGNPPAKVNDFVRARTCPPGSTTVSCNPNFQIPTVPATDAQIEQAVSDGIGSDSDKARAVAQAAQDNGFPPMADGQPQASGPTVVEGPSSQTVQSGPNGQTIINETTNYNISYGGDTITVIEETTTTTTKPDGSTTTETQSNSPPPVPAGSTVPAATVNLKLPDDYAREKTTQGILSKLTGIFDWLMQPVPQEPLPALPEPPIEAVEPPGLITDLNSYLTDLDETAACAPDYTISILGASVVLPMQPFCDLADLARPLNQIFFIIFAMLAFFRIYAR